MLKMASEKAETHYITAIDVVSTPPPTETYDYHMGMSTLRTIGLDYAYATSNKPNSVVLLFDADTKPVGRNFVKQLLDVYSNSSVQHYKVPMS